MSGLSMGLGVVEGCQRIVAGPLLQQHGVFGEVFLGELVGAEVDGDLFAFTGPELLDMAGPGLAAPEGVGAQSGSPPSAHGHGLRMALYH
ncbi:MAG: hypothetical protein R3242_05360, partial [Akkermansiaceae bacterium]|nr:hypothetical protein [Akkermansiaceae bacterium]